MNPSHTTDPPWIASSEVVAVHPDGTRTPGTIRISAPSAAGEAEAYCTYAIDPIGATKSIHGADSLQALVLAIRMCAIEIALFQKRGGYFEHPPEGEAAAGEVWSGEAIFGAFMGLPTN